MKNLLIISALLLISMVHIRTEAAATSGLEANKIELFVKKYLLKLYNFNTISKDISVPQKQGYDLDQAAVIEEAQSTSGSDFDYLAVYKHPETGNFLVVLYDNQNAEQLLIDSVKAVNFKNEKENSRILLERTGPDGQEHPEALLVPGRIKVAQKG